MADDVQEAARALFDAVQETVEQIAPSSGADPTPLAEEDVTALILWTYQFLRDDLRCGVAAGPQTTSRVLWEGTIGELFGQVIAHRHGFSAKDRVEVVAAPTGQEDDDG